MAEIDAEVKKWGNTLGIRVPAAVAHAEGIGPGDRVRVTIEKATAPNPAFFGMAKRLGVKIDMKDFLRRRNAERRRERAREARRAKEWKK